MAAQIDAQTDAYRALHPAYVSFSSKLQSLLIDILNSNEIKYQIVESRAKEVTSFSEKITRAGKSYTDPVNEITDLCGCRVIVYYIDDIDKVAKIIKGEFSLHEENLTRQPDKLEADRFGYLSAHYIVKINEARSNLIEWLAFSEFKAEIQIRTVIQHAWSAVSHALQYKQETAVPSKLQRRLYRIAGLFELADDEFVAIRDIKEKYLEEIRRSLSSGNEKVPLSPTSIKEFVENWDGSEKLRLACLQAGFEYAESEEEALVDDIYKLSVLGEITNIEDLSQAMSVDYKEYLKKIMKIDGGPWMISRYFGIMLILILYNKDKITGKFLSSLDIHEFISKILMDALELRGKPIPRKRATRPKR